VDVEASGGGRWKVQNYGWGWGIQGCTISLQATVHSRRMPRVLVAKNNNEEEEKEDEKKDEKENNNRKKKKKAQVKNVVCL
jgi:hypothetical protein